MSAERVFVPYEERVATVVGRKGALGSRVFPCYQEAGFREVHGCEQGDPFLDFVNRSTDLFLAVDDAEVISLLEIAKFHLGPQHTILDGASNKSNAIDIYLDVDSRGASVCPTHLGARPDHPWQGMKFWLCRVGQNCERGIRTGMDLFIARNVAIDVIDVEEHQKIEIDQCVTFLTAYVVSETLRSLGIPLKEFDCFATLNAEFLALLAGRTQGQGVKVPSEVLFRQDRKFEIIGVLQAALERLKQALSDREELEKLMQTNIDYHDNPEGLIGQLFRKAGIVGSRNANLRMCSLSFRITRDRPGKLRDVLKPFFVEDVNLTAIDSMQGEITEEERLRGVDPDGIIDFDIGVNPKTINPEKARRIKETLWAMGCQVADFPFDKENSQ